MPPHRLSYITYWPELCSISIRYLITVRAEGIAIAGREKTPSGIWMFGKNPAKKPATIHPLLIQIMLKMLMSELNTLSPSSNRNNSKFHPWSNSVFCMMCNPYHISAQLFMFYIRGQQNTGLLPNLACCLFLCGPQTNCVCVRARVCTIFNVYI